MDMWAFTGVTKSNLNLEALRNKQAWYTTLAEATSGADSAVSASVRAVMEVNRGPAADGFSQAATGSASIGQHIGQLVGTAVRTAAAYGLAAQVGVGASWP